MVLLLVIQHLYKSVMAWLTNYFHFWLMGTIEFQLQAILSVKCSYFFLCVNIIELNANAIKKIILFTASINKMADEKAIIK